MGRISFIVPVVRQEKAKRCIAAIKRWSRGFDIEIVSGVDEGEIGCPRMVKKLAGQATGDYICFLGDDTIPQKDFLKNAMRCFGDDQVKLVGLYDGRNEEFATHWIARADLADSLDGEEFFYTGYKHCFCDMELWDRAQEEGGAVLCHSARVVHDHPAFKQGIGADKWYEKAYDEGTYAYDQRLYWKRKRERVVRRMGFYPALGEPNVGELVRSVFHRSMMVMDRPSSDWVFLLPSESVSDFPTDWSRIRNNLSVQALNHGCTHLLMFDTDQVYPRDTMRKLITSEKWKDPGTAVVSALVYERYPPFLPAVRMGSPGEYHPLKDEVIESGDTVSVNGVGSGCVMISTAALLNMTSVFPWFKEVVLDDGEIMSEDINFCYKLKCLGYNIYVDTSIDVTHIMQIGVSKQNVRKVRDLYDVNIPEEGEDNAGDFIDGG